MTVYLTDTPPGGLSTTAWDCRLCCGRCVRDNLGVVDAGYCPYCARDVGRLTDEHVIPQRIGGNFVIKACEPCNRLAGQHVDNPAMSYPDVEILRGLHDVRSPKRPGQQAAVQIVGQLADGARALYRPGRDVSLLQVEPSEPIANEDGTFTWAVPANGSADFVERLRHRIEAENPGRTVAINPIGVQRSPVAFEYRTGLTPWVWPRFLAKVAVALLHETMPAAWRGSDQAVRLLAMLARPESQRATRQQCRQRPAR